MSGSERILKLNNAVEEIIRSGETPSVLDAVDMIVEEIYG